MAKKTLSAEDSALFRQTIGKVQSLKNNTVLMTEGKKPKPYPKQSSLGGIYDIEAMVEQKTEKAGIETVETLYQEDSFHFIASGLQKNVLKKLRKGHFGLDAFIDLHGLTRQQASFQLSRFLSISVEEGCRCVHIIHGKGYRSSNDIPVLKNNINVWLRQHQAVQAFCSTPSKAGGAGAVFVLLKLSRKYHEQEDTEY